MKYIFLAIATIALLGASCNSSTKQTSDSFERNLKCKEIATQLDQQKREDEQKSKDAKLLVFTSFDSSETKYSEKLNTCLYSYTLNMYGTGGVPNSQSRYLIDSLTNEVLAQYTTSDAQSTQERTDAQKAFYDKYSELYLGTK